MGIGLLGIGGWSLYQTPTGRHAFGHAEEIVAPDKSFDADLQRAAKATHQVHVGRVRVVVPHHRSLAPVLTLISDGRCAMRITGETGVRVVMYGKWRVSKTRPAQLCVEPAANRGNMSCLHAVKHGDLLVFDETGVDDPWKRTEQVAWNTAP